MKKIIYINKEVEIGDMVAHNGVFIEVTNKSVEANPSIFKVVDKLPSYFKCVKEFEGYIKGRIYEIDDHPYYEELIVLISEHGSHYHTHVNVCTYSDSDCFELTTKEEWNKQELLDEAKRRYPIGTVFNMPEHNGAEFQIEQKVINNNHKWYQGNSIIVESHKNKGGGTVYMNGKWAEILPLKFTTEDDVDIYGDMKTWLVDKDFTLMNQSNYSGAAYDYKYFYHKENALAYIEKHKGKPLEDYEDILCTLHQGELERSVVDNGNIYSVSIGLFYRTLKLNEPKLYYTKILQLIADYLNDARYIHERGQASFHINKEGRVTLHMGDDEGCVYFKSKELAFKAIDIMGSKLEYLFN